VLAAWSGLGYYSRARNLHRAAKQVAAAGAFPNDYKGLLALAGVGPYTAAAIASIAFGWPCAVLDGNVMRVISRLENDASDLGSPRTRAAFLDAAQRRLDPRRPGEFNQAMMELGATVCVPRAPLCGGCPVKDGCQAFACGTAAQLPVKLARRAPERVAVVAVVVRRRGAVLLWRRPEDERAMAGFWDLPSPAQLPSLGRRRVLGGFRHTITHRHYSFTVVEAALDGAPAGMRWFPPARLAAIPLATTARKALRLAAIVPPLTQA
jgi:A/G-specific adenine glycosylase